MRSAVAIYADGKLLLNALISLGSAALFNPEADLWLFVKDPDRWRSLSGVRVMNVNDAFRELCFVDLGAWDARHRGDTGHIYRKVVAWNYLTECARQYGYESLALLDADTLVHGSLGPALDASRSAGLAGLRETWHDTFDLYNAHDGAVKRELDYLFCGNVTEGRLRRTPYLNAGAVFAAPDGAARDIFRDLLRIGVMHPHLATHTRFPEQTLMNIACAARGLSAAALNEYGFVSGDAPLDDAGGPVTLRHYLGQPEQRKPSQMIARYAPLIEQALRQLGLSVGWAMEMSLWY